MTALVTPFTASVRPRYERYSQRYSEFAFDLICNVASDACTYACDRRTRAHFMQNAAFGADALHALLAATLLSEHETPLADDDEQLRDAATFIRRHAAAVDFDIERTVYVISALCHAVLSNVGDDDDDGGSDGEIIVVDSRLTRVRSFLFDADILVAQVCEALAELARIEIVDDMLLVAPAVAGDHDPPTPPGDDCSLFKSVGGSGNEARSLQIGDEVDAVWVRVRFRRRAPDAVESALHALAALDLQAGEGAAAAPRPVRASVSFESLL
jgi:hypothetical protein